MSEPDKELHAAASQQEMRALDADESKLADLARHPALGELTNSDLSDLVSRLRSRRDRARDIANRQGREARAKADPAGASAASGNAGTLTKHDYLKAALERAIAERTARGGATGSSEDAADPTQHALAEKAMEMKDADQAEPNQMTEDGGPLHPNDPDASPGKKDLENTARRTAPSGALDHAGELPARERSRTRY